MSAVSSVAIAGSGVAAMAAAIRLADAGIGVDVFYGNPSLAALDPGHHAEGKAVRALDALGVWDRVFVLGRLR